MSIKNYRLKVNKIPLPYDIIYKKPNFTQIDDLYLELLENKIKLKKNAPKPIFVRPPPPIEEPKTKQNDELTLEELEKAYAEGDVDNETFSDLEDDDINVTEDIELVQNQLDRKSLSNGPSESSESSGPSGPSGPSVDYTKQQPSEYTQNDFKQNFESEEDLAQKNRDDFLFKFMVLKRRYPAMDIPEFTEHSDIHSMKRAYNRIMQNISLDNSVNTYKQFLTIAIIAIEAICTNLIGIDMSGFFLSQNMGTYDNLLIELGEKGQTSILSKLPVEIRLLGLILINTVIYGIYKTTYSNNKTANGGVNSDMLGSIFKLFGGMGGSSETSNPGPDTKKSTKKGSMKGPTITPEDILKMD